MSNGSEPRRLPANVVLVGFMGSGKTSTGRCLARSLGYRFADMDAILEEREGMPVVEVFRRKGETYFRGKESDLVSELAAGDRQVIATGGGAWMDEANRARLLRAGWCVWMKVSADQAWERVRPNLEERPLLAASADPLATLRRMLAAREPAYALAPAAVDTDGASPETVADRLLERMNKDLPFDLPPL